MMLPLRMLAGRRQALFSLPTAENMQRALLSNGSSHDDNDRSRNQSSEHMQQPTEPEDNPFKYRNRATGFHRHRGLGRDNRETSYDNHVPDESIPSIGYSSNRMADTFDRDQKNTNPNDGERRSRVKYSSSRNIEQFDNRRDVGRGYQNTRESEEFGYRSMSHGGDERSSFGYHSNHNDDHYNRRGDSGHSSSYEYRHQPSSAEEDENSYNSSLGYVQSDNDGSSNQNSRERSSQHEEFGSSPRGNIFENSSQNFGNNPNRPSENEFNRNDNRNARLESRRLAIRPHESRVRRPGDEGRSRYAPAANYESARRTSSHDNSRSEPREEYGERESKTGFQPAPYVPKRSNFTNGETQGYATTRDDNDSFSRQSARQGISSRVMMRASEDERAPMVDQPRRDSNHMNDRRYEGFYGEDEEEDKKPAYRTRSSPTYLSRGRETMEQTESQRPKANLTSYATKRGTQPTIFGVTQPRMPRHSHGMTRSTEELPIEGNALELARDKSGAQRLRVAVERGEDDDECISIVREIMGCGGPDDLRQLMSHRRAYSVLRAIIEHGATGDSHQICAAMEGHMLTLSMERSSFFVVESMLAHLKDDDLRDKLVAELLETDDVVVQCCNSRNGRFVMKTLVQSYDKSPSFAKYSSTLSAGLRTNMPEVLVNKFGHTVVLAALECQVEAVRQPIITELLAMSPTGVPAYPLVRFSENEFASDILCKILAIGSDEEIEKLQSVLRQADENSPRESPRRAAMVKPQLFEQEEEDKLELSKHEKRTERQQADEVSRLFNLEATGVSEKFEQKVSSRVVEKACLPASSQKIQDRFVTGSQDVRKQIFDQVLGNIVFLSTSLAGSHVVRVVLERGTPEQRAAVARELEGHLVDFSTHRSARFVVEAALTVVDEAQRAELVDELLDEDEHHRDDEGNIVNIGFARLADHEVASFVVRHLLEVAEPAQQMKIAQALKGSLTELALNKYGHFVVEALLKCGGGATAQADLDGTSSIESEIRDIAANELLEDIDNFLVCATDVNGTFTIQTLVERGSTEQRNKAQCYLIENIHELSIHKYSHFVILKALMFVDGDQNVHLIDALLDNDPDVIRYCADRPFGKFVMRSAMERGNIDQQQLISEALEGTDIKLYDAARTPAWM